MPSDDQAPSPSSPSGDEFGLRQRVQPLLTAVGLALTAGWAATRRAATAFADWWTGTGWPRIALAWRTDVVRLRRWSTEQGRPRATAASRRTAAVVGSTSRRTAQITATASRATAAQSAKGWSAFRARQSPTP